MRNTRITGVLLVLSLTTFASAQEPGSSPAGSDPPTGATAAKDSSATGGVSPAEEKEKSTDPNLAAIESGAKAFADAFNKGDAAAIAGLWTVDGEYVDATGTAYTGRPAIEKVYKEFFDENPGAKLQIRIDSFKLLSDSAAMEEGRTLVEVPPTAATIGRYMAVHVKVDGKWQMASVRDAMVETNAAERDLTDLEFLIGTWAAEEQGNKNVSVCRWVCDQSFVQRDFTTTLFDGTKTSGVQLIGWNPLEGHVQSWTFSSGGGHDVGLWMPTEDGWVARMQGMTGEGIPTTSTNLLRRLDDNAYVWQSIDRTLGGAPIPDTSEVVIKRQPATK